MVNSEENKKNPQKNKKKNSKNKTTIKEIKKNIKINKLKSSIENLDDIGRIRKKIIKFKDEKSNEDFLKFLKNQKKDKSTFDPSFKIIQEIPTKNLEKEFSVNQESSKPSEQEREPDSFKYNVTKKDSDESKYTSSSDLQKIESFVAPRRREISEIQEQVVNFSKHRNLMKQSSYPEFSSNDTDMYKTLELSTKQDLEKNKPELNDFQKQVKYNPSEY